MKPAKQAVKAARTRMAADGATATATAQKANVNKDKSSKNMLSALGLPAHFFLRCQQRQTQNTYL
jgi:hypothetical protein